MGPLLLDRVAFVTGAGAGIGRAIACRFAEEGADIAAVDIDGPAAEERLARKIINGGAGSWGNIPMVANERVSLKDARAIAHWVLSLAPVSTR